MAPAAVETPRPPPRIPKLKYRNHLPPDHSSLSLQETTLTLSRTISTDSRPSEIFTDLPPIPGSATDSFRQSSDSRSTTSSFTSLDSSHGSTTRGSTMSAKKKKQGVFGFLSVKEPSQLALEQFAKSQRQQSATKGGSSSSVGLQGISPAKLPANVPKVNSKWDGVPESVKSSPSSISPKKKDGPSMYTLGHTSGYRDGLNMSMSSVASVASRGAPNSLASSMIDVSRQDSYRPDTLPSNVLASETLTGTSYLVSGNQNSMSGALPITHVELDEPKNGPLPFPAEHPWSPPRPPPQQVGEAVPLSDMDAYNPGSVPLEQQRAPLRRLSEDAHVGHKADAIFKRLKGNDAFLAGEAREVKLDDEEDDSDDDSQSVPESHGFLFAIQPLPSVAISQPLSSPGQDRPFKGPATNFSRPRPLRVSSYKSAVSSLLPTLYECSIASTDTVTDLLEEETTPTTSITRSESFPTPSSTPTRSISSRERLGLGGRVRKMEVLPWENQDDALAHGLVIGQSAAHGDLGA